MAAAAQLQRGLAAADSDHGLPPGPASGDVTAPASAALHCSNAAQPPPSVTACLSTTGPGRQPPLPGLTAPHMKNWPGQRRCQSDAEGDSDTAAPAAGLHCWQRRHRHLQHGAQRRARSSEHAHPRDNHINRSSITHQCPCRYWRLTIMHPSTIN